MLFIKNKRNTLNYHLVTDEPSFTANKYDWLRALDRT